MYKHIRFTHTCISFNTTVVVGVQTFCLKFKGARVCQGRGQAPLPVPFNEALVCIVDEVSTEEQTGQDD